MSKKERKSKWNPQEEADETQEQVKQTGGKIEQK